VEVTKTIVCLANSDKFGGFCVAGIELVDGKPDGWIRPVGDNGSLDRARTRYDDGTMPKLLDIIEIALQGHKPDKHQQENWLISDSAVRWKKRGEYRYADLKGLLDSNKTLWELGNHSTEGVNDWVWPRSALKSGHSLKLIYVNELKLYRKDRPTKASQTRARFMLNGSEYDFVVTDPDIKTLMSKPVIKIKNVYLTISLAKSFRPTGSKYRLCYKLVAAIIAPEGYD